MDTKPPANTSKNQGTSEREASTGDAPVTPEGLAKMPADAPVTMGILRAVMGDVKEEFAAVTETLAEISGSLEKLSKTRSGPAKPVDPEQLDAAVTKALATALSGPLNTLENRMQAIQATMGHALSGQKLKDHNNALLAKGAVSAKTHTMMYHEGDEAPRVATSGPQAAALRLEGFHDTLDLAAENAALAEVGNDTAQVTPALVQKHRRRIHGNAGRDAA